MASLLPSEVARLVLGYLEENGCQKSSEKLSEELAELSEFVKLRRKGRQVSTRVGSQSLEDMLMDYSSAKDLMMESVRNNSATLSSVPNSGSLLGQIEALISIVLKNKFVIKKQKSSIGTAKKVNQYSRTIKLHKKLRMRKAQQQQDTVSADSLQSLPGSHDRDTDNADHCLENGPCSDHSHSSSQLPNSAQVGRVAGDVEDTRQDSLGGDSTSASLTHDLDISHQRRKGTVKRRSHGCEASPTKMSPVLDTEANFEKILKNLYENTALHEKIAESINRGLSTQCSEGGSHSSGSPCSKKVRDSGSGDGSSNTSINTTLTGEGREKYCGSVNEVAGNTGGDVALLKEFDHIVTGIVSEATSDPVFENLIDEVFGCISPPSSNYKGDGSSNPNQVNLQDNSIGPPRLLSTPVPPPPSSAMSSPSVLHIPQTLPQHPSSVSPIMSSQPSADSLSTPHHPVVPLAASPRLPSPSSSFIAVPHSAPSPCKSFPESTPKKNEDVWSNKSLPQESSPAAKTSKSPSSEMSKDAMQESLLNSASVNHTKESTVDSWSSPLRMETDDGSVTKHNIGVPSANCGAESSSQKEGCEATRATSPSPTRSRRKKKLKCSPSAKSGKEEDKNLGEQLLKEFADFQSSRSDKICVEEKGDGGKNTDRCEVPKESNMQPLDLPTEEGKTKDDISRSDPAKSLNEGPAPISDTGQETHSPGSPNTGEKETGVVNQVNENVNAVNKDQSDKGTVQTERIQCKTEPDSAPLNSEPLSAAPYDSYSNVDKTDEKTGHKNKRSTVPLDSISPLSIRSNTIPGIGNHTSSPEENSYTLTELTPVNPIDLTSIVSSLCEPDEPHLNYQHSGELATTSGDHQTPLTSEHHNSNMWGHSAELPPLSHMQEGASSEGKERETSQGLTIILPPVSSKEEADEQFLSIFGGVEAPSSELVTVPYFPGDDSLDSDDDATPKSKKRKRRRRISLPPRGNRELVTIAPKTLCPSSLPPVPIAKEVPVKGGTTYTLPNNVTISIPDVTPGLGAVGKEGPKKRRQRKKRMTTEKPNNILKVPKPTIKKQYGRVIDMSVRRTSARAKKRTITQNQTAEKDMKNDIIGTALSFALKSVTPEKKSSAAMDQRAEVNTAVDGAAGMLGVAGTSITESCGGVVQTQSVGIQTTKYSSGRSPQLKALLHLSKSISPAKRALAWKNVTHSEESPLIQVLHMRGSQSTPSRKNSHIRVLDFSTPQKVTYAGSPRKAVANLKFSPPEAKKSPRKLSRAPRSLAMKLAKQPSASKASKASKRLSKIAEESEMGSEISWGVAASQQPGKAIPRRSLSIGLSGSSTLKGENSDLKSKAMPRWSRKSSASETEFSIDTKKTPVMMTEDEDSIVLYLDGEDSMSSSGKTPPTDSGSIELFDISKDQERYQDFNFNTALKNMNPDSLSEDDLPCLTKPLPSSSVNSHSPPGKQMETPHKAPQAGSSITSMTPVCFEPPTPFLLTEQKSNSLPCDDLNTPIPQVIPSSNKTPLIKHYPQGPYSSSSVGTSYYMPSERSLTGSEDYSPSKLDNLLEKTLTEELHSPGALDQSDADMGDSELNKTSYYIGSGSDKSPFKRSAVHDAKSPSPTKLSRKAMGQIIEKEMSRLFSSQDSSDSVKETSQDSAADVSNDSNSKDSSKGKPGKKRRVPSEKYQNIAESTCSEDEFECKGDSTSASRKHKRSTRKSGGSNLNAIVDKFDSPDNTREIKEMKLVLSSPDKSKTKKNSPLFKGRLDSEEHAVKPEEVGVKHSQDIQNQLSPKQQSPDSKELSCHSPKKKITSDKEKEQDFCETNPESLIELFGFCSSSDTNSEFVKKRTPITTESVPTHMSGEEDNVTSTGMIDSDSEFTFESPVKKRKRYNISEDESDHFSPPEDNEQNTNTLRRSKRLTRGRGVEKYQAGLTFQRIPKMWQGNTQQKAKRGRGRSGDLRVEEVVIEAVIETHPSQCSKEPHDGDVAQEEIAAKRNAAKDAPKDRGRGRGRGRGRRKKSLSPRGRSSFSPGSDWHPGQELQENEETSGTQKASEKSKEVEEQENEEQDGEALRGQHSSKQPFSRWGSGMKTSDVKKPMSSPPVSSDTLKAHWTSKLKQLGDDKDVSSTSTGEESAKKQPCVSTTDTHPAQQNLSLLFGNDSEDDLPYLNTPKLPQKKTNVTPAEKPNTAHSEDKPSRKRPRAPSRKAPHCQDTTPVQKEGTQKQKQQQSKGGVHNCSLPQGCARTVVYEWEHSSITINQLKALGSMGQILNVTSLFTKKLKAIRSNRTPTSEPSAKHPSFTRTTDVAEGQTSTSKSSAQKESATDSTSELSSQDKSNTPEVTQRPSGEEKSNTQKSTQKLSAGVESNTQENTQKPSVKGNSSTPENTEKLADKEKNSVVRREDQLVPRNTPDSFSSSASQLSKQKKSTSSKSRIQSPDSEGSSSTKPSPSSSSAAFDAFLPTRTVDTISSGSKKVSSSSSVVHSKAPPEDSDRLAQDGSDSADTVPSHPSLHTDRTASTSAAPTPSTPVSHSPQRVNGLQENDNDVVRRTNKDIEVSLKPPKDKHSCKKTVTSDSHVNEKEYCSASPRSAESYSDLEEMSEEHCLMSYTMLPPTPEKKMGRICHTIVKEGKAMVAFPSPSKPYPLPEQALSQSPKLKTQFRDQVGSPNSSARRCLDLKNVNRSSGSGSAQNKANQSPQRKPEPDHSLVSSGKAYTLQENNVDQQKEKTITTNEIQLKVGKDDSLDKGSTVGQGGMEGEGSHLSDTSQNIRKEKHAPEVHTKSEQSTTSSSVTLARKESPKKQNPADLKHFSAMAQQHPEAYRGQGNGPLREEDCDKLEEEEDSDVLRIEEPSENENEEMEEVICTLSLTLTDIINIFSMNIPEKQKPKVKKKPTLQATKQNKQARKSSSPRKKAETPTQKSSPQPGTTPLNHRKNKSPQKKRTSSSSAGTHTPLEEAKRISTVKSDSKSSLTVQSPTTPRDTDTDSGSQERRQEHGCYAGRSKPAHRVEEKNSAKKGRRITPIRIGDVEQHGNRPKGSWGDVGTSKKSQWAQNQVNTSGSHHITERRGGSVTQTERPGGCQGNLSERSASSLSSLSPGCLLISESPRGADSSPAPCPNFTSLNSPHTSAPILATPTKAESLSSSLSSNSASKSISDSRARKQQSAGDTYYVESETSREPEYQSLGKQRKVRHMAKELHRGGNLEIARSPDKQLAVMMSHPQEGVNIYMSEESFHSLSSTPPTPGKHLFIPPPPILASSFSSTSNSSSSSSFSHSQPKQELGNVPLKKRKGVAVSGQGNSQ